MFGWGLSTDTILIIAREAHSTFRPISLRLRIARQGWPSLVNAMCRVLGVTRSGYYAWKKRPKPARASSDARLAATVAAVHKRSRLAYGSPRVHRELKARGMRIGKRRVERLMRENGIQGRRKRRFRRTTDSRHDDPIAPNLLARDFKTDAPNRAWVTDVTAIATAEGWVFLAAMLDLFSRRIVGWAMSTFSSKPATAGTKSPAARFNG
jgi:putative transposase